MCYTDVLEKGVATHSSILAWRIPWTEESAGLQSTGSQRSDMTEWLTHIQMYNIMITTKELLNRHYFKEEIQMANRHMKRCPTLLIREVQFKTIIRNHLTRIRTTIVKKSTNNKDWKGCAEKGIFLHCWWECEMWVDATIVENDMKVPQETK